MSVSLDTRLQTLAEARLKLLAELSAGPGGLNWCRRHAFIADQVVQELFETVSSEFQQAPSVALLAIGGYGRQELAPYSDVDIAVLPLDEADPNLDAFVRRLFRVLHEAFHDVVRLDVGYNYRLVRDTPSLDEESRTGLLDSRVICGSAAAYDLLSQSFWQTFPVGEFLLAKIGERERGYKQYHDTPLVVEPHLKEGCGGIRDFHAANWISEAVGEKPARPTAAFELVIAARNALQYLAGKKQDSLTRQRQAELADLWGRDVFELMSDICSAMCSLEGAYNRALAHLRETRFIISPNVMSVRGEARVLGPATLSQAAVGVALASQLGLNAPDVQTGAIEEIDGPAAVHALAMGELVLRNLDVSGLLARLLPELNRCKTLLPNDSSHRFTVFEHTIRVIRNLDTVEEPFMAELKSSISSPELLYLAALLHDVGKAVPDTRHSESGEVIARQVCERFGLGERVASLVSWIVREHLLVSEFIRVRDVANPATAIELTQKVNSQERLDMLCLLTWADASAVNEHTWTPTQTAILRELHTRTTALLSGDAGEPDPQVYRKRLLRELASHPVDDEEIRAFVDSMPAYYVLTTSSDTVQLHLDYMRRVREGEVVVELFGQANLHASELTVCCPDFKGLLSHILGVIYAYDLSTHGLRAATTRSPNPVALDVFTISHAGHVVPRATAQGLLKTLRNVLAGVESLDDVMHRMGKDAVRKQDSFSYRFIPGEPGILEIQAPRGRGMAYRFSRLIRDQGWNIVAAKVGQWAGRATAGFYLTGPNDQPLTQEEVSRTLEPHAVG